MKTPPSRKRLNARFSRSLSLGRFSCDIASIKSNLEEIKEEEAANETAKIDEKPDDSNQMRGRLWKLLGFIMLFLSVLGGSLIGPSSNLVSPESGWVKVHWVHFLRTFYCMPLVVAEILTTKDYGQVIRSNLSKKNIAGLLVTPMIFGFAQFALIYGADNTIQAHAYVCNNL